ncbi:MAG: hypothetical protein ABSC63_07310 [Candidatus Binataceae bacterium]|jgi:hypothetical protein
MGANAYILARFTEGTTPLSEKNTMNQARVFVAAIATLLIAAGTGTIAKAAVVSCVSNSAGDKKLTGTDGGTCDADADTGGVAKAKTVGKFESFATAHNSGKATSLATVDSTAQATADHGSTATATAKSHAGADATADNSSSAVVTATNGSGSEATSDSGGTAKATGSNGNALAEASGCSATASAKNTHSGATALCTGGSTQATSSGEGEATAQASADCKVVAISSGDGSMSDGECVTAGDSVTLTTTKGGVATYDGVHAPTCKPGSGTAKVVSSLSGKCP